MTKNLRANISVKTKLTNAKILLKKGYEIFWVGLKIMKPFDKA